MKLTTMTKSNRTTFVNYINALQPLGGTYHDAGMVWGARLISPTGIFADENGPYRDRPISRHIVFMTDGDMAPNMGNLSFQGYEWTAKRVGATDDADLTNLIAIAEMTPGSLGVNAATFAGTKTAGMPGGVFAVLGVLSPTLTLTLLAAAFFQKFRTSKVMSYIMKIVKPVCIGMVLGVLVGLCRQTCITEAGGISLPGIAIGILCFVLLQKFKLSVPKVIGIAAVLGLVCFGVF